MQVWGPYDEFLTLGLSHQVTVIMSQEHKSLAWMRGFEEVVVGGGERLKRYLGRRINRF